MSAKKRPRNRGDGLPELNLEGIVRLLRRLHPRDTAHLVAARTGISHRTVENWLHANNEMRALHLLVLVDVYGPEVLACAWPVADGARGALPEWLDAGCAAQELAQLEAERVRNETRRMELQARLTASAGASAR